MELVSVGTALEHELRHYHDFLLGYGPLHSYWQRSQAMINATPIISQMLDDPDLDYLVFPALGWAGAAIQARKTYLSEALDTPDAYARVWSPPVIAGTRPAGPLAGPVLPRNEENIRHALFVLREQMDHIEGLRGGILNPSFPFPFTPRFVSEASSLLVQCASVQQTYGFADMDLFMNRLAVDGSLYARFFSSMVLVFSGRGLPLVSGDVAIVDAGEVDWRALGVGLAWCQFGSSADPGMLQAVDRMSRLVEAIGEDRDAVFPPTLHFIDLLAHLDSFFGVEPTPASLHASSASLRGFLHRGAAKIRSGGQVTRQFQPIVDVFESLLVERDRVVARFLGDPEGYLDAGRYVRALPQWPQCPVTLDLSPAGVAAPRELLGSFAPGAVFGDVRTDDGSVMTEAAAEVSYPSFLPGGTGFPYPVARSLADTRDVFDLFFDPQQIGVERENQIRQFIARTHDKMLVRFMA